MEQLKFIEFATTEPLVMAASERPQQRMESFGVSALSDTELLALIIQGNGTKPEAAVMMATRLIAEAGSMPGLATWTAGDYERVKGIGRAKALQLATLTEIARRIMDKSKHDTPLLNRADIIAEYMGPIVTGLEVEKFWVLALNRRNRLIKRIEISSGSATSALAHPREVFRAAVRESATGIVCVHNHPSGDPAPSAPDLHVTRLLRDAARTIDIALLDHVIVGRAASDPLAKGWYSFRDAGLL